MRACEVARCAREGAESGCAHPRGRMTRSAVANRGARKQRARGRHAIGVHMQSAPNSTVLFRAVRPTPRTLPSPRLRPRCLRKYGSTHVWRLCTDTFDYLCLAAVVADQFLYAARGAGAAWLLGLCARVSCARGLCSLRAEAAGSMHTRAHTQHAHACTHARTSACTHTRARDRTHSSTHAHTAQRPPDSPCPRPPPSSPRAAACTGA
jgi:hypothetical protein